MSDIKINWGILGRILCALPFIYLVVLGIILGVVMLLVGDTGGRICVLVVCLALGLSFLATLYPSWRASKTDPVEALRYE